MENLEIGARLSVISSDGFLEQLDLKMSCANDRKWRKLLAWAEVLDAAGWCVALTRLDGETWLSPNAILDLENRGMPVSEITAPNPNDGNLRMVIRNEAVRLWAATKGNEITTIRMPKLTRREDEVFNWLRAGKSGPEMAVILGCAIRTVEKHVANLYRKIGAHNRTSVILNRSAIHS